MTRLVIKSHLWMNGGSVGIAARIEDDVELEILTQDKSGFPLYPGKYRISKKDLLGYETVKFGKGVPVRVVPIRDLEVVTP